MIDFERDGMRFFVRVAGVCVEDGHALLHRTVENDFWIMPGGRCELHEPTRAAIARELHEEFGVPVRVGRLLWIVENLYNYRGRRGFEIAFFYRYTLPSGHPFRERGREHSRVETFPDGGRGLPLIFQWVPINQLGDLRLFPSFLHDGLRALPRRVVHRTIRDVDA